MVITPNSNRQSAEQSSALVCAFGGVLRKLPNSAVETIEPILTIAPLPCSKKPLEGLMVGQDDRALPIFDFSMHLGGEEKSGSYSINVRTSKGVIRLRANGILSLDASKFPEQEFIPFALDEIEEMIASFTPAETEQKITTENVGNKKVSTRQLLFARVDQQDVAFDACHIDFMERHLLSSSLNHEPSKRVITLQDGSLINGISLGVWTNEKTANPATENWSIGYSKKDHRLAITVSQVIGFENIPLNLFHKIEEGAQENIWVNHPKLGPLKVYSADSFNQDSTNQVNEEIGLLIQALNQNKTQVKEIHVIEKSIGIGMKFNDFSLVIPRELIRSIKEGVSPSDLTHDSPENSLQSFDLTKIPFLECSKYTNNLTLRAISLKRDSEEIVVLTPDIYEPSTEKSWSPLPALPDPLSQYFQAVRVQDGSCEFLLRGDILSNAQKNTMQPYADQIFCGWLSNQ